MTDFDAITSARRSIALQTHGLEALAADLGEPFAHSVTRIAGLDGRLIVSGIGKSGHIARKIASTLASTGTPAFYVHPAEASHGDLGMITAADGVLALSNSGETAELRDLVEYTRLHGIPLIAMTRVSAATLAVRADIALVLPAAQEACSLGLAPTTSSTQMLVLGDALAVALLERRGFSHLDYKNFHPGGRLGASLALVGELMMADRNRLPLVAPATPMSDAILTMSRCGFGCVGVVAADGRLAGIITDGDLRRKMGPDLIAQPADAIMTPAPKTVPPDILAASALNTMNESKIVTLFVTVDAVPVGLIQTYDCVRAGLA